MRFIISVVDRHLGSQLAEMEKLIEKMLQADFVKYAMSDLNRPVTDSQALTQEVGCVCRGSVDYNIAQIT